MRLTFDVIEIEGFKSYVKKTVLDLSGRGTGLHFVRGKNLQQPDLGSNGAGKSSLWDALTWCLYGRTIEGLRNPDLTPWYGNGHTRVCVLFRCDDDEHVITRTIKPNKLELDDRMVGQEHIDEFLRMPIEVFGHTILLGQAQPLFFDLKASTKLELFSTVLKLDRWDEYSDAASKRAKEMERQAMQLDAEAAGIDRELARVGKQLEDVRELSRQFAEERAKRIASADLRLQEMTAKLESEEIRLGHIDLKLDGAGTELKALGTDIPKAEFDLKTVQKNYDDFSRKDWEARSKVTHIKGELDKLREGKNCPTCGQAIKGTNIKGHQKELLKDLKYWEGLVGIPNVTKAKLAEHTKKVQYMRNAEQGLRNAVDTLMSQMRIAQPQVDALRQDIKVTKQLQDDRREVENPHSDLMQSLRKDRQRLTQEQRELLDELMIVRRKHVRAKFWIKGFSEVRLYIVNDILQELQLVTAGMLNEFGLSGWDVQYSVEQETKSGTMKRGINVMVLSPSNDHFVNWKSWSSGEGQRLRVLGALALSQVLLNHVGVEPAIEILDEPSSHLSEEGIEDMVEYLSQRARDMNKVIFLTDHSVIESSLFTSVLTVLKKKSGSVIEE